MADLSNLSLEELQTEQHRLMEARAAIKEQLSKVKQALDQKKIADKAQAQLAGMSETEKRALAQTLHAEGILSDETFGDAVNKYPFGSQVKVTGTFKDENGTVFDPAVVKVSYRTPTPAGALVTKVYGTDAEVVKVSTGIYRMNILGNVQGTWYYRWFCDNALTPAAYEGRFYVENAVAD